MSISDVAERKGCNPATVRNAISRGDLHAIVTGKNGVDIQVEDDAALKRWLPIKRRVLRGAKLCAAMQRKGKY